MIKPVAIYLPQFHPTPENDEWWGKGFTEWTNVTKNTPLFKGHYQPHLPTDFGFYDLRNLETIEDQARTAKENGIFGFGFYHYWFGGKRLLHEPVDRILQSPKPDFPFLLFWANETWSRRWLGEEKEILIKQEYSLEDDQSHADWLCSKVFSDSRYIKVEGKPVFVIYRPFDLPDYRKTIEVFRDKALQYGFPGLYLVGNNAHSNGDFEGFDAVLNFEPQLGMLPGAFDNAWNFRRMVRNFVRYKVLDGTLKIYEYDKVKDLMMSRRFPYKFIPCPFVGWDNTPRRGDKGVIIANQNPKKFAESLVWAKKMAQELPPNEQFVFINAWNEWAEGNHLEPCIKDGKKYLSEVKKAFLHE